MKLARNDMGFGRDHEVQRPAVLGTWIEWFWILVIVCRLPRALQRPVFKKKVDAGRGVSQEDRVNFKGELAQKALIFSGNLALILFQALVFFVSNLAVTFGGEWVTFSVCARIKYFILCVGLLLVPTAIYFVAVISLGGEAKGRMRPPVCLAFLALFIALGGGCSLSGENRLVNLIVETVLAFFSGLIAWDASRLINNPSDSGTSRQLNT